MKTILAPGLKARQIGIKGWLSTNILGNRDGEVLDDPRAFKTKEESKFLIMKEREFQEGGALNSFGENFDFEGVPIKISFRENK